MSVTPIRRAARNHDAPSEAVAPSAPIPFGPRSVRDSDRPAPRHEGRDQRALGQLLLDDGAVDPGNLLKALVMHRRESARLGEILLAHGWVTEAALSRALSRQWRTSVIDLKALPPDSRLIDEAGADWCLSHGIVPWRRTGGVTFVAASRPDLFEAARARLEARLGPIRMLLCAETDGTEALLATRKTALIRQAETCVAPELSCRTRNELRMGAILLVGMVLLAVGLWVAPVAVLAAVSALTILTLAATTALKALAFRETLRGAESPPVATTAEMLARLPVISVMVPMFREEDIADRLVGRLARLDYPRELTDILLVVEETDQVTRGALAGVRLPSWIRVVTVPDGPIRTKPRALNYALNFCRGSIIGVWDAEDRPESDQLHKIARHFHFADDKVACVQGALDFYNPRTNWLARCFTLEYSAWFRGILPGLARLGLVVPLGGTTFFIRRDALDRAGRWDGWNVTEDADLGVRLARLGYVTEIVDTTTHEEANCRAMPWIKQRSRWLKGFAMTWGVHMRDPRRLWREIGPARTIGFHLQMFATVQQFLLAPILWSFWLLVLGLNHPVSGLVGGWLGIAVIGLFIASEALNLIVAAWSVRRTHPGLMPWAPTLYLYFPLACLAAWKAAYEIVAKPFYWDKTTHGVFDHVADEAAQPLVTEAALIPLVAGLPDVAAARLPPTGNGLVGTAGAGAGPGAAAGHATIQIAGTIA